MLSIFVGEQSLFFIFFYCEKEWVEMKICEKGHIVHELLCRSWWWCGLPFFLLVNVCYLVAVSIWLLYGFSGLFLVQQVRIEKNIYDFCVASYFYTFFFSELLLFVICLASWKKVNSMLSSFELILWRSFGGLLS